jgi:cytochrome c biogenesis protein CcmG/thiol:disulfide interchange protein DsbE
MDQKKRVDDLPPPGGADGTGARDLAPVAGEGSAAGGAAVGADADGPPRGRGRWVMAAVAALGVALFAVPFVRGPGDSGGAPAAGAPAASTCSPEKGVANFDITLKDMNGQDVRLADYKGKVVLLNFWATWCGPCRVEIPELVHLVDEHKSKGFEVIGVSIDDTPEQLRTFAADMKMNYPSLLMRDELEESFGPMWALPTTFIIDRAGSICMKHMGPVTKEMVEREITGLL